MLYKLAYGFVHQEMPDDLAEAARRTKESGVDADEISRRELELLKVMKKYGIRDMGVSADGTILMNSLNFY